MPSATSRSRDRVGGRDEHRPGGTSTARTSCASGGSRRAATRRAAALSCASTIDSASDAIATPCGSWAWTTSGPTRWMTRDSRHAALRSSSWPGASGTSSSPSAARRRSSPSGCATSMRGGPPRAGPSRSAGPDSGRRARLVAVSMWRENMVGQDQAQLPAHRTGRSCRRSARRSRALQLPELRELQQHVVGVQQRHHEPRHALPDAATKDVVAQERATADARRCAARRTACRPSCMSAAASVV